MSSRYEFGTNWASFIENHYSAERRQMAAEKLLAFLGDENLERVSFLDIGSGSGLHSLAAFDAKATRIHSFDFDPLSVKTTGKLRQLAGEPPNWTDAMRIGSLAKMVVEATKTDAPIVMKPSNAIYGEKFAVIYDRVPDISLLTTMTGWRPLRSTKQTIIDCIEHLRTDQVMA